MKIRYAYINPTGNITILVVSPVDVTEQVKVAAKLIDMEPNAEQVGFVTLKDESIALRMAGGEFCGNATISSVALYCFVNGIPETEMAVTVSGTPKPVETSVTCVGEGSYIVSAMMPTPKEIFKHRFLLGANELDLPVVDFGGITHVILDKKYETDFSTDTIKEWASLLNADAFGVMILDMDNNYLKPVVYVKKADTLYYENSCASGTIAVACYLHNADGNNIDLTFEEPGGSLRVEIKDDNIPVMYGKADIVSENEVEIDI